MRRRGWLAWGAIAAVVGCGESGGASLIVDVKTDLVPVREFVVVRTEIARRAGGPVERRADALVTETAPWLDGTRVAEVEGIDPGTVRVRVSALAPGGEVVVDRVTVVRLRGRVVTTVILSRSCRGVVCPPDGAPELEACAGGRCVDPSCSPENPDACGTPECDAARPCTLEGAECAEVRCVEGTCFVAPDDARCATDERCDADLGCVSREGMTPDAGRCTPAETACSDGEDEDCDGAPDCADTECEGTSCGANGRLCAGGGCVCPGGDLEDVCSGGADDDCDGAADCADSDCETLSCGTRGEVCAAGACACPGPPAERACGDGRDEDCDGSFDCADADCDTLSCGSAGEVCTAGACSCTGGSAESICGDSMDNDCDADTDCADADCDGSACGATVVGAWGACGGYSNACDQTGTQTRAITSPTCRAGACTPVVTMESRGCSRTVANGTSCGSTWQRCCSGMCVNLATDETHCGSCNQRCVGGATCASTGNGGYACRGCASNAECRGELDANATCYDLSAPPAFCQCQCLAGSYTHRVCANGGCGAGFWCHACAGNNWCAPFGGSCP